MSIKDLKKEIQNIGREVTNCPRRCKGIVKGLGRGIIPRGLILEEDGSRRLGCVIVGINPGNAKEKERNHFRNCYIKKAPLYECYCHFWEEKLKNARYYSNLRDLARRLGFKGAILWTEVCKCERDKRRYRVVPIQTLVTCMESFLKRELEAVNSNVPIIAASNIAYQALCYSFPDRFIIGVPHPTGSKGHFKELLRYIDKAKKRIEKAKNYPKKFVRIFPSDLQKDL